MRISKFQSKKKKKQNGTKVIQIETNDERVKIKSAIENELGDNYEINATKPRDLIVAIKFITFKYSEKEILEKIKKQNPFLSDSDPK